jgi:hypothetical protein
MLSTNAHLRQKEAKNDRLGFSYVCRDSRISRVTGEMLWELINNQINNMLQSLHGTLLIKESRTEEKAAIFANLR